MTLRGRVLALLGALSLLLAVDALLAVRNIRERDRALAETRILSEARNEINALLAEYVDQETGLRGFVITADERFLESYETSTAQADRLLSDLRRRLTARPEPLDALVAVQQAAGRWRADAAALEIAAIRAGRRDEAVALVGSGVGRTRFDALRAELNRLHDEVLAAQERVDRRLEAARSRLATLLLLTFALDLLLVAATTLLLRRWVTIPLREISAALRVVAAGRLEQTIPATGPPELAQAARDAEAMRRRIVAELEEAVRAREALKQRGALVLNLRLALAPSGHATPASIQIATEFEPAEGIVAGDWYDVVTLDRHRVALAVADVSGHGSDAGILALRSKELVLAALADGRTPGDALDWVAGRLGDTDEMFLTCVIVEVDARDGSGRYASAGHAGLLVASGDEVADLEATGPLLGPLDATWGTQTFQLERSSTLLAYTDGLTEARDAEGREFGLDRLRHVLSFSRGLDLTVRECLAKVRAFTGGRLRDDVTIVGLSWSPDSAVQTAAGRRTAAVATPSVT